MSKDARYTVGELAELGGVSRRTVRYYVQENLLPAPDGLGRGSRYRPHHLEQLLKVKALQEEGLSLLEIRRVLTGKESAPPVPRTVPRTLWTRIPLLPGVELHVSGERHIPAPGKLSALAEALRRAFPPRTNASPDPPRRGEVPIEEDSDD